MSSREKDRVNPTSSTSEENGRISPVILLIMRVNFRFLRSKFGYGSNSAPIIEDINKYLDGKLKPVRDKDIDESKLFSIKYLEKINKGPIIEVDLSKNKKYEYKGYCINLGEKLKKDFEERCGQDGLSISEVVRGLMYPRIIDWKKKYEATRRKEEIVKSQNVIEGENRLKEFLEWLKSEFEQGFELVVEWLPDDEYDNHGEVKGNRIYIYDEAYKKAEFTLAHEYLEHGIHENFTKDIVNSMNLIVLLYRNRHVSNNWRMVMEDYNRTDEEREKFIDKLAENLVMRWHMRKLFISLLGSSEMAEYSQTASHLQGEAPAHSRLLFSVGPAVPSFS